MATEDTLDEDVQTIDESNEVDEESTEELDTGIDSSNSDSDESSSDSDDEEITKEQLDEMDDDEFAAFLDTGKLPTSKKTKSVQNAGNVETKPNSPEEEVKPEQAPQEKHTQPDIDYKTVYDSIFKPFKANGKTITPRSVDDVVSLMQMGANYTKKMQTMAPMKKAVESLTKAGINEEDLNFLIDLHKGNQEAIKKLLQKNSVDPMDLDLESTNYVPNTRNIASDEDVEFSDVINDLGDSLPKVQEIVNSKWDKESKSKLLKNPDLLRKLGEEVQLGRFDAIQEVLEEEKTFGRYKGVSDLDAYVDIVTKYVNYQNAQAQQQVQQSRVAKTSQPNRTTKNVTDKSKAAPTRSKPSNKTSKFTANDIFSMSEEDFNKLSINDLIM